MDVPDISILIPTWNGASILERCILSAISACRNISWEILIFDNGSTDNTNELLKKIKKRYPQIKDFSNTQNLLFAKPINQLADMAIGKSLLILNNDVFLKQDCLKLMLRALYSQEKIGAVAPQLMNPDETIQPSCRRLPTFFNMVIDGLGLDRYFPQFSWKMRDFDHKKESYVEQPMMSALLIKRSCWENVGPLDERFPLYFNDVDWCRRALKKGWLILFFPKAKALHLEAWSGKRLGFKQLKYSVSGLYNYFMKHDIKSYWSPKYPLLLGLCAGLCSIWLLRKIFH